MFVSGIISSRLLLTPYCYTTSFTYYSADGVSAPSQNIILARGWSRGCSQILHWVTLQSESFSLKVRPPNSLRGRFVGHLDPASEEERPEEGARRRKGDYAGLCREFW